MMMAMEQQESLVQQPSLFQQELQYIHMAADIRRSEMVLKRALTQFRQEPSSADTAKAYSVRSLALIKEEIDGETKKEILSQEDMYFQANSLLEKAKNSENADDLTLAALYYARVAKMQEDKGLDYNNALASAKNSIVKIKQVSSPLFAASDFLPEAIVLGIEKRMIKKNIAPTTQKVAAHLAANPWNTRLLADYSLILTPSARADFIAFFPKEQKFKISSLMDQELTKLFISNTLLTDKDRNEKKLMTERVKSQLQEGVDSPNQRGLDKSIIKALSQILSYLDDEKSKNILKAIGESGLKTAKEAEMDRLRMSYLARIIKTLVESDTAKGGVLTMKFLAKSVLPTRLFTYFCYKLIEKQYLTANLKIYLEPV